MSAVFSALVLAGAAAGWLFFKLQDHTGRGNNQGALTGAGVTFAVLFIILFFVLHGLLG